MPSTLSINQDGLTSPPPQNEENEPPDLSLLIDPTLEPLKILMATVTTGEIWVYSLELARALNGQGHQIILATLGPLTEEQCREIQQVPNLKAFEGKFGPEWDQSGEEIETVAAWLLELEEVLQPDLIHLNSYALGDLAWQAPTVLVGHPCRLSTWEAINGHPAPGTWNAYRRRVQQGLQAADKVLAPTQAMLKILEHRYGPLPQGHIVPHGGSPELFRPGDKKPFIFAVVSGEAQTTDRDILATVAPLLPWPIYMAGKEQALEASGPPASPVNSVGSLSLEALQAWLAQASIYVLPAQSTPSGLSVIEAALAGCALVLGDTPTLREVWGNAALYVPPDDPHILEVAILLLIIDPVFRQIMSERAYERAQQFTSERMAANYLSVCWELIHATKAAA